ncbi:MAG TPA: SDR family oxidoreductase [Streptosporangiaceae bacterium]|jgi:3-oxoacyl-[acyl-carrier protein] reductase
MTISKGGAFVTGASGGIGRATVLELHARGYAVALADLARAGAAAELAGQVGGVACDVDVSDPAAVASAIEQAESQLGPIEVAVSCAGFDHDRSFEETDDELWSRSLRVLLGGCVNVIAAVAPGMRARGRGSIVNIASELALLGDADHVAYVSAKAAVLGLTRAMALELAPGVRVNCVCPGPTDTAMLTERWRTESYLASIPLGRFGQPGEVATTIVNLAEATWTTGQVVSPNGGVVIQ